MKRGVLTACVVLLLPLTALASDADFNQAVSSIEHTYHLHRQRLPLIGLASFCAHVATGGAVQGIRIAAFDGTNQLPESADMPELVRTALGAKWSMIVQTRGHGEQDAIYAQPHGQRMTMLIASYSDGDLSVMRVDMDAARFRKWLSDPAGRARHLAGQPAGTN